MRSEKRALQNAPVKKSYILSNKNFISAVDSLNESSQWRCEDCSAPAPSNLAVEVNGRVSNSIRVMEENGLDPETCEKFIMIHSRILHPQHGKNLNFQAKFQNLNFSHLKIQFPHP